MSHEYAVGIAIVAFATVLAAAPAAAQVRLAGNPAIDMQQFLRGSAEAAVARETRRVSEDEFIRMSREPATIVLDARSRERFDMMHVRGAVNLSFPDIAVESLRTLIPDVNTRILLYCNNNFTGAEDAFPTKLPAASLNLSTFVALYVYGYRNVYELAPTVDLRSSKLVFDAAKR
jgi:hypothetical protein